jgi:hypothetical protein
VGVKTEVEAVVRSIRSEGKVSNVLHVSGILHDAVICQQSPSLVREVYAPKGAGAANLLEVGWLPDQTHQ